MYKPGTSTRWRGKKRKENRYCGMGNSAISEGTSSVSEAAMKLIEESFEVTFLPTSTYFW